MKVQLSRDILVDPEVTARTIDIAFEKWLSFQPRYRVLRDYYRGWHYFDEKTHGGDRNRIIANHCRYITDVLIGYQFGNEPRYSTAEEDAPGQDIIDLFQRQDKWNVEIAIGESLSKYGRTNELVFMPKDKDEPNSIEIDPLHGFVAYAGDVEKDSVFGVVVFHYTNNNRKEIFRLYVYDAVNVSVWEALGSQQSPRTWTQVEAPVPHGFGRVPLIEYKNNREAMGDYEGVMELQDAYNSLLSDRQDNQDSFAQAMLVLSGATIGITPDEIRDKKDVLKDLAVLQLDDDAVAQYLVKTSDESGVQIVQDQYAADIHKFAMVPNLTDEQFAGNASGVAMSYKLFGTDQIVSRKQSQMQKGFTRRCKLYDYRLNNPTMNPNYEPLADIDHMVITFNLNAPQDLAYVSNAVSQLTASKIMSKKTARGIITVIPDPDAEAELVKEESEEEAELTRDTYDYDAIDAQRMRPMGGDDEDNAETDTEE